MTDKSPEPGDRVVARWAPCARQGEVEEVYCASDRYQRLEIAVRWNDGAWKTYDADRFISEGSNTWSLER